MTEPLRHPWEVEAESTAELGELSVLSQREGAVHTISLCGELDLGTVEAAERELERVEASDAATVVLDLSGLRFMDSTGVRLVVAANARFRESDRRLLLLRGPANVQRVLELCGVVDLLPFAD